MAYFHVLAIIFGKVMKKPRLQKIYHTIRHTILIAANLRFVPGNDFSRGNSTISEVAAGTVRLLHTNSGFTTVNLLFHLKIFI
jgi:hypothetical protein